MGLFFNTFIIYEMQRKIVRNDCFREYPIAFFIVFKEVAHAVLIQTFKVKSLFILTYIFKTLLWPLSWGNWKSNGREMPTEWFLTPWFAGNQADSCQPVQEGAGESGWDLSSVPSASVPISFLPKQTFLQLVMLVNCLSLCAGEWRGEKSYDLTYPTRDLCPLYYMENSCTQH